METKYLEQEDVTDYLYGGVDYLNRRRQKIEMLKPLTSGYIQQLKTLCMEMSLNYGRTITFTFKDEILDNYSKKYILSSIRSVMDKYTKSYLIVEDYAPTDGRFHLHGVFVPRTIKKINGIKRNTRLLGYSRIGMADKLKNADYIFKIYEKNTKTVVNGLGMCRLYRKMIIMDTLSDYSMQLYAETHPQ